mmetsp:Transcript_37143/g.94210  ORF Transcript_37143/g.94210 Transcript_37143/m.94210 type:complete len:416 (-) Transcript_37143:500-1747(-)
MGGRGAQRHRERRAARRADADRGGRRHRPRRADRGDEADQDDDRGGRRRHPLRGPGAGHQEVRPHGRQGARARPGALRPARGRTPAGGYPRYLDAHHRAHRCGGLDLPHVEHRQARPRLHPRRHGRCQRPLAHGDGRGGACRGPLGRGRRRGGRQVDGEQQAADLPGGGARRVGGRARARAPGGRMGGLRGRGRPLTLRHAGARCRPARRRGQATLLLLGAAACARGLLPSAPWRRVGDGACQGVRPPRRPDLDGDGEARGRAGRRVRRRRACRLSRQDAGVQSLALLQLGRRRHGRLADRRVHERARQARLCLAVHHARGLPLQRPGRAQLCQGLRRARHGRVQRDDPARGAAHGRAPTQAPGLVGCGAHGPADGTRLWGRRIHSLHGRGRDGGAVRDHVRAGGGRPRQGRRLG